MLVHLEEGGDDVGLGEGFVEAVGVHDGLVVGLVSLAEFNGHGELVVEVGKGAVGIQGAGVEDGLGGLFDLRFLGLGGSGPGEVVVDDVLGITVITLQSATYSSHPCHVND